MGHLVPTQTNKNLATNAIKGLSIPSRPLARVRSDRYDKIIFLVFFMIKTKSKESKINGVRNSLLSGD